MALSGLLVGRLPRRDRLLHPAGLRRGRQDVRSGLFVIPGHLLLPLLLIETHHPRALMDSLFVDRHHSLYPMDPHSHLVDLVPEPLLRGPG